MFDKFTEYAAKFNLYPDPVVWMDPLLQGLAPASPVSTEGVPYYAFRMFAPQYIGQNAAELEKISGLYASFVFKKQTPGGKSHAASDQQSTTATLDASASVACASEVGHLTALIQDMASRQPPTSVDMPSMGGEACGADHGLPIKKNKKGRNMKGLPNVVCGTCGAIYSSKYRGKSPLCANCRFSSSSSLK